MLRSVRIVNTLVVRKSFYLNLARVPCGLLFIYLFQNWNESKPLHDNGFSV